MSLEHSSLPHACEQVTAAAAAESPTDPHTKKGVSTCAPGMKMLATARTPTAADAMFSHEAVSFQPSCRLDSLLCCVGAFGFGGLFFLGMWGGAAGAFGLTGGGAWT
jgi:hypothetical protein